MLFAVCWCWLFVVGLLLFDVVRCLMSVGACCLCVCVFVCGDVHVALVIVLVLLVLLLVMLLGVGCMLSGV